MRRFPQLSLSNDKSSRLPINQFLNFSIMITCHPVSRYFSRSLVSLVFLATAALELQGAEDTNPPMSQPTDGPTWTEMSGNRFRRIRLDGIPIPAEKGQAKSETDEESEESEDENDEGEEHTNSK